MMPAGKKSKEFCPSQRSEWRDWLRENHARYDEVWLIYYKKHTGKPTVTYRESLEEALCFGWIDGIKKRIDEERYTHRFSPRAASSQWSEANIALAEKLIEKGLMDSPGLKAYERGKRYPTSNATAPKQDVYSLSKDLEQEIRKSPRAWENYSAMAPSYQKKYAAWLMTAKRPETVKKRLKDTIERLEQNLKPGMN